MRRKSNGYADLAGVRWAEFRAPSSAVSLCAGLIGASAAATLVTLPTWALTDVEQRFFESTSGTVWLVLIASEGLLWGVLLIPMIRLARLLWDVLDGFRERWRAVATSAIVLGIVVAPTIVTTAGHSFDSPVRADGIKLLVFTSAGAAIAAIGLFGIGALNRIVSFGVWGSDSSAPSEKVQLARLERVRVLLDVYLLMLGALIFLAVAATAALRSAVKDFPNPPPTTLVWVYAAYLSLMLALVYLTTATTTIARARDVIDAFHELPNPTDHRYETIRQTRLALELRLRIREPRLGTVKVALAILAPLLGALPTRLLS